MRVFDLETKLSQVIDQAEKHILSYDGEISAMGNNAKATALLGLIELKKWESMQANK